MSQSSTETRDNDRQWQARHESAEEVRQRLRRGWRNDAAVLQQYFNACYHNWKVYEGPRTAKQVIKLQALYKQAVYGDNHEPQPVDGLAAGATAAASQQGTTLEGEKWLAWYKLKGMSSEMAKRRFITFLMEIHPSLIDVMPDERPPVGFPLDRKGNPICAKCNTLVGCSRPLLDQRKMNLRMQLFEHEELHQADRLREWIRNALVNQRCVWGMHMPITRAEANAFVEWFNRDENRGFFPYDSISIMEMVKDLVEHYHEQAYDMMKLKATGGGGGAGGGEVEGYDALEYNAVAGKALKIKAIFEEFSGESYRYEVYCTRDNESCNLKRLADGGRNHKHEVFIDPPSESNANTLEEAMALRQQCQKLGLSPCTGVVKTLEERCNIYRQRIADHMEALKKAEEAKARNDIRHLTHRQEKDLVLKLSKDVLERQVVEACLTNQTEQVLTLAKRDGNVNLETPFGVTPLQVLILNEVPTEKLEVFLKKKVDLNQANRRGMTALMLAARLKDLRAVHVLMKHGALALAKGFQGRTALHFCAVHHSEEAARVIVDYLREGIGDSMRVVRFLDAVDDEGETALMVAAEARNGLFCHVLLSLGANPNIRNRLGRTAVQKARDKHFPQLADWLEKKVSAGAMKVETYSDIQFEKQTRFGYLKVKELIQQFGKTFLMMTQGRTTFHPLGCPAVIQRLVEDKGTVSARQEQRRFVDNHQRYVLKRSIEMFPSLFDLKAAGVPSEKEREDKLALVEELRAILEEIYRLVKQGYAYPNTEPPAQPLAWTPLLCAVALNDHRLLNLFLQEGADVNYQNRDGMTALMLAAQLQEADLLVSLLGSESSLEMVDNQGYSALAYASILPLPSFMDRDMVDVLLDNDVHGPKLLSTSEVLTLAKTGLSLEDLQQVLQQNEVAADPVNVERHAQLLNILTNQSGLSNMTSAQNVFYHLKTMTKRLPTSSPPPPPLPAATRVVEEEAKAQRQASPPGATPRCPFCTLRVPCSHFYKVESLQRYLRDGRRSREDKAGGSTTTSQRGGARLKGHNIVRFKNRIQELLEETNLNDRQTDRSVLLAQKYQQREEEVEQERERREEELLALPAPLEEQQDLMDYPQQSPPPPAPAPPAPPAPTSATSELLDDVSGSDDDSRRGRDKKENELLHLFAIEEELENEKSKAVRESPSVAAAGGGGGEMESYRPASSIQSFGDLLLSSPAPILKPSSALGSGQRESRAGKRVKFALPSSSSSSAEDLLPANDEDKDPRFSPDLMEQSATSTPASTPNPPPAPAPAPAPTPVPAAATGSSALVVATESLEVGPKEEEEVDRVVEEKKKSLLMFLKQSSSSSSSLSKVKLSGWIYMYLAPLHADIAPLATLSISQHAWFVLLQHLCDRHEEVWSSRLRLTSLVDGRHWRIAAPKCLLCSAGFVRTPATIAAFLSPDRQGYEASVQSLTLTDLDDHLCWTCLMRKEIFQKIQQALPRVLRLSFPSRWPVVSENYLQERCDQIIRCNPPPYPSSSSSSSTSDGLNLQLVTMKNNSHAASSSSSFASSHLNEISALSNDDFSSSSHSGSSSSAAHFSFRPKEIDLVAYLISCEHFDEAERTIRIALDRFLVDDSRALLAAQRLVVLQADMYKLQGLHLLAVSLLLDLVDRVVVVVGWANAIAQKTVQLVLTNYFRVNLPDAAQDYLDGCIALIEGQLRDPIQRKEIVATLKDSKRSVHYNMLLANSIFLKTVEAESEGSSPLRQRFLHTIGLGGVYSLLTSSLPYAVVLRTIFSSHCHRHYRSRDARGAAGGGGERATTLCVDFLMLCCRYRLCDDEELKRLFLQQLLLKYLSKRDVAQLIFNDRQPLVDRVVTAIEQFLSRGVVGGGGGGGGGFKAEEFLDDLQVVAMEKTRSPFLRFLLHGEGEGEGEGGQAVERLEAVHLLRAEIVDVAANVIQCFLRGCLARKRLRLIAS